MLEGHALKVLGPMQGDHVHATALWAPDIKALFAGDLVFNQVFLWLGEHEPDNVEAWSAFARHACRAQAARSSSPAMPSPACPTTRAGSPSAAAYLDAWPELVAQAKDSPDLQAQGEGRLPARRSTCSTISSCPIRADVAMGVQPVWEE